MTSDVQAARERLERRRDAWLLNTDAARVGVNLGDLRTILSALTTAEAARDEAIRQMSRLAWELGEAQGRLEGSELAGVVNGWRVRAETAERERDEARALAEAWRIDPVNRAFNAWLQERRAAALVSAARETEGGA